MRGDGENFRVVAALFGRNRAKFPNAGGKKSEDLLAVTVYDLANYIEDLLDTRE